MRKATINITREAFLESGHGLVERISELLKQLDEGKIPVTRGEEPDEIRQILGSGSLPEEGRDLKDLLDQVAKMLFDHSLFNGHPRFWGYITAPAAPAGVLAEMLAAGVNPNVGAWSLSPIATEIELQAIKWMAEMTGYPSNCGGIMVSGGNMANFLAFMVARTAKADWDIAKEGIGGGRKMIAYCSEATHTWIQKAANFSGIGTDSIRWVKTNEREEMVLSDLKNQIISDLKSGFKPFFICGTAGTVSTGAIDPLNAIAEIAKEYDLWFHVDGAYGAPANVLEELENDFAGLERADSIALDPHKWLYSPLEAGCTLVKDKDWMQKTFSYKPAYYAFDEAGGGPPLNFYEYGFQNSRGFRALKVWISLMQVGRKGYAEMIREDIALAKRLFEILNIHPEFEVYTQNLSITTFRYVPLHLDESPDQKAEYLNNLNRQLLAVLQKNGEIFVSNAVLNGVFLLRACIVNFRTSREDIDAAPEIIGKQGRLIHQKMKE